MKGRESRQEKAGLAAQTLLQLLSTPKVGKQIPSSIFSPAPHQVSSPYSGTASPRGAELTPTYPAPTEDPWKPSPTPSKYLPPQSHTVQNPTISNLQVWELRASYTIPGRGNPSPMLLTAALHPCPCAVCIYAISSAPEEWAEWVGGGVPSLQSNYRAWGTGREPERTYFLHTWSHPETVSGRKERDEESITLTADPPSSSRTLINK